MVRSCPAHAAWERKSRSTNDVNIIKGSKWIPDLRWHAAVAVPIEESVVSPYARGLFQAISTSIMFKLWVVQTLLSLLVLLDQAIAQTLRNITVDNTDPGIAYIGNWDPSASHPSVLDIGGSHTLSEDATGSATFAFTGVAVYYLAPKWPYPVDSYVSLDGGAAVLVNMTGPAQSSPNGEETVQSAPLWSATGLSNGSHRVVVTRGPSQYAVVDGFIYTTADSTTTSQAVETVVSTTTVQPNQGTSSGTRSQASSTSSATTTGSSINSTVIIAVTVSASVACLILLILFIIFCTRRTQKTDPAYRKSTAFSSGGGRRETTYNIPGQAANTYSATYSAVPLTENHPYAYPYSSNNAGMEMGTRDSRYSAVGYSDSTTGSASGGGSLSAQQQMSYANAPPYSRDAYGLYPVSNRALVVPAAGAAYNTGGSGTGTDWYNASPPGAGGGYRGGNSDSYNAGGAYAYAGVGWSSAAAVAPPNQPPSPLSAKARFEGSHTPHVGGSNAGHSAYTAYASTSNVAAPIRQPSPASEKVRYNNAGAGVYGPSKAHPYNAAGPISPSEPPPSYADRPGPSGSRPTPSSPPRPNKMGFI